MAAACLECVVSLLLQVSEDAMLQGYFGLSLLNLIYSVCEHTVHTV